MVVVIVMMLASVVMYGSAPNSMNVRPINSFRSDLYERHKQTNKYIHQANTYSVIY